MARTFVKNSRRLPWRVIGLWGYSTVGKDTLIRTLQERGFAVAPLSAGYHNKLRLMELGVPAHVVLGNSAERDQPCDKLPVHPETGVPYTPRTYEVQVLNKPMEWLRNAVVNEKFILRMLDQPGSGTVVFHGYRGLAQHQMLMRLQRRMGRDKVLLVKLRNPKVKPRMTSGGQGFGKGWHDAQCNHQRFDAVVWNRQPEPPMKMVRQLMVLARRMKKKRAS